MKFIVVHNFSEAVDPKLRRKRLANVLRRARKSTKLADVYLDIAGHERRYGSRARAGGAEFWGQKSLKRAGKAAAVYGKRRLRYPGELSIGFKRVPRGLDPSTKLKRSPKIRLVRARTVGYGKDKVSRKKIGKN